LNFQEDIDIGIISHGISIQDDGTKIELYATYKDNIQGSDIIISETYKHNEEGHRAHSNYESYQSQWKNY